MHQKLVNLVEWCLLDFKVQDPQLLALDLRGQKHKSLEYGNLVCLMLLGCTIPHHVELLFTNPIIVIKEL